VAAGLVIFIAYDETDRAYSLRDMILLSILFLGMALFYLRSRSLRQRGLTLVVGVPLILAYTFSSLLRRLSSQTLET
jgi:hypothetical protein